MKKVGMLAIMITALFLYSPTVSHGWQLVFINVGNGDSIILTYNGTPQVVVDGGPDSYSDYYLSRYFPFSNCYIPYLILTHPHKDHLYGLTKIINHCKVDILIFNQINFKSSLYTDWLESISKSKNIGSIVSYLPSGNKILINDLTIHILWPAPVNSTKSFRNSDSLEKNPNNNALVLLLDYFEFEALLMADVERESQSKIDIDAYKPYIDGPLDVIKVPHQGSIDALNPNFLDNFSISKAVLSVGPNSYGHPSSSVVSYYESLGTKVLRTDILDTITIQIFP